MEDETIVNDTEDTTETQETDTEEVEQSETEETQEADTDSTESDDQYTDDPEEWLGQYREKGLPENIKSPDDLLNAYLATLPEMKRTQTASQKLSQVEAALKAKGYGDIDGFVSGQKPDTQQSYFEPTAATKAVEDMKAQGMFAGDMADQTYAYYKSIAQLTDRTYGEQFKKAEQVFGVFAQTLHQLQQRIGSLQNSQRDIGWKQFNHPLKKQVDAKAVYEIMDSVTGMDSFDKAMAYYLGSDPARIVDLIKKQQEAQPKNRQFKGKFKAGMKGSRPQSGATDIWSPYRKDGRWDDRKIDALPAEKALKILEAYKKATGKDE